MIAALALAATQFEIGSIVPDGDSSDCEPNWFTPTDPETREAYTSKDIYREDVAAANPEWNETRVDQHMSNAELRDTENGTIVQLEEGCS